MNAHVEKTAEKKSEFIASSVSQMQTNEAPTFEFMDYRPEAVTQMKLQHIADGSPQVSQLKSFQEMADNRSYTKQVAQLQTMADTFSSQQHPIIQRQENNTGLPDNLKTGMENLTGHSMNDVKVHRNSDKPAQLNAHAYAQGTDIHLAPGQEKHLPHELGHVVQQKEGRVKPTKQLKGKTNINDDAGLEKEADVLGNNAINHHVNSTVQKKETKNIQNNVAQREVGDDVADTSNETMKAGAGFVPVAYGSAMENVHTNNSGIASDFIDGANAFKNAFQAGKDLWSEDPKKWSTGAAMLAEGSKGILAVVKASIAVSGASKTVTDSANTLIPGIGAGIGAFQNVMSMMQNQATWSLVSGLDNGLLSDKEKEKVSSFVSRLDAKLGLDLVDFIFNIAEFIAMFTGTGPAVALVHSCFNIFKGACQLSHGYFVAKGVQADTRVTGDQGEVDREEMATLDLHLKESNNDEAKPSKSIFGMVKSYGAIKSLKAVISEAAQQDPPDETKLKKDREMLALRKRILRIDLKFYNENLKPKKVSDPKAFMYGKVEVPNLTLDQIPTLYKIHMNVIRQIIKQARAGEHGYSKLKAWAVGVKKTTIFEALEAKLGIKIEDDLADWKLLSAMDPEQAGYFTEKTKTAIHVASKRKYFGDEEIQKNLQEILIAQKDKFLPLLSKKDDSNFTDSMTPELYAEAIKEKIKF